MSETLTKVPFGQTDMTITRAGFGAWAIGGGGWAFAWGDQEDDDSVAAIRHAVESGINWVDTAAVYGLGHSEEVVARALRDLPEADRPLRVHQGWLRLGRVRPLEGAPPGSQPGQPAPAGGGVAAPPGSGPHRPVPVALARGGRDAAGGVLADVPGPARRRQDPRRRAVQPQ